MHVSVCACVRVTNRCSFCAASVLASSAFDIWESTCNVVGVRGQTLTLPCFGVEPLLDQIDLYIFYEFITFSEGSKIGFRHHQKAIDIDHPYQKQAYRARDGPNRAGNETVWVDILQVQLHDGGRYACLNYDTFLWKFYDVVVLGE